MKYLSLFKLSGAWDTVPCKPVLQLWSHARHIFGTRAGEQSEPRDRPAPLLSLETPDWRAGLQAWDTHTHLNLGPRQETKPQPSARKVIGFPRAPCSRQD